MIPRDGERRLRLVAVLLLCAAGFGLLVAVAAYGLRCSENCTGRSWQLVWQLVVAIIGFFAVFAMTGFVYRGRWNYAATCFVVSLVLYAVWGLLLDAASH